MTNTYKLLIKILATFFGVVALALTLSAGNSTVKSDLNTNFFENKISRLKQKIITNLESRSASFYLPPPTWGTVSVRVNSSSDDAEQRVSTGSMTLNSSDLELIKDGSNDQVVGLRFNSINVPKGAQIINAYLEFEVDETSTTSTSLTFWAQASDNPTTFTSSSNNISSRSKTTASVAWNSVPSWTVLNAKHKTPNLASVVQEIVNRGGWVSGNSMAFIIQGSGTRMAESWDGEAVAAPLLVITYDNSPQTVVKTKTSTTANALYPFFSYDPDPNCASPDWQNFWTKFNSPNQFLFEEYADGTAVMRGTIQNIANTCDRWDVYIKLVNKRSWSEWSALGRMHYEGSPSGSCNGNRFDWSYYEVDASVSRFSGTLGYCNETKVAQINHNPTNYSKGPQVGFGSSNCSGCSCNSFDVRGWFRMTGDLNLPCGDYSLSLGSFVENDPCHVLNPGFEENQNYWNFGSGTSISTDAHSGSKSALLSGNNTSISMESLPATGDTYYELTAWAKVSGSPSWTGMGIDVYDGNNDRIQVVNTTISGSSWKEYKVGLIVPSNAAYLSFWVWKGDNGSVRVDDFCMSYKKNTTKGNCTSISNSGFESTIGSEWNPWGSVASTTDRVVGSKAASVKTVDGGVSQGFSLTPGNTYELCFYAKISGAISWAGVGLTIQDGSWNDLIGNTVDGFTGSYRKYSIVIKAPANGSKATVWATKNGTGTLFLDEFCLRQISIPVEICGNGLDDDGNGLTDSSDPACVAFSCPSGLLTNPEFESNLSSWSYSGTTSSTSDAFLGTKAAATTSTSGGIWQNVSAQAGQVFSVEVYAKKSGSANVTIGLEFYDSNWNYLNAAVTSVTATNFTLYRKTAIAPPNTAYARAVGWKHSGSGSATFDGWCMTKWTVTTPTCNDNSCKLSPSYENYVWSMDDSGNDSNWKDYDKGNFILCKNANGTISLKGQLLDGKDSDWHQSNATTCGIGDAWEVNLVLSDKKSWSQFQGSYVQKTGCGANHVNWDYWNVTGTLTGLGCNAGRTVTITGTQPGYRLQVGKGGNSENCGWGLSTWMVSTENGVTFSSDIYANIDSACYASLFQNIELCGNGIDDDGDGHKDLYDADCNGCKDIPSSGLFFSANFENTSGDNAWTLGSAATDGNFEIGVPYPYVTNSTQMEIAAHGGNQTLLTGNDNGQDLDGGVATARSPNICIPTGANCAELRFYYYYADADNGDASDYLNIQIRNAANGSLIQTIASATGNSSDRDAAWKEVVQDLSAHAGKNIYIYLEAADFGTGSKTEIALDDVTIRICSEICNNGIDDDDDGLIDSSDPDCRCNAPVFSFRNPTLISGSASAVGSVYEFSNVVPNTKARLTILSKSHSDIVIHNIDEPASSYGGYDDAIQPIIDYNWINGGGSYDPAGEKSVTFQLDFIDAVSGGARQVPIIHMTGLDIDGSTSEVREFFQSGGFDAYEVQSPTTLSLSGALKAKGSLATYPGIDEDALSTMISYVFYNKSSIVFTYGGDFNGNTSGFFDDSSPNNSDEKRMNSLYLKCYEFEVTIVCPTANVSGGGAICNGQTTTLTVNATGGSGTSNFQWQSSDDNNTWTNINGATGMAYVASPNGSTKFYRVACTFSGNQECGTIYSNAVSVSVTTSGCTEICNNGFDDDGDGQTDSNDSDCACALSVNADIGNCKCESGSAYANITGADAGTFLQGAFNNITWTGQPEFDIFYKKSNASLYSAQLTPGASGFYTDYTALGFGASQNVPVLYSEINGDGYVELTYNFDYATQNIYFLVYDLDYADTVKIEAWDASGNKISNFSGWTFTGGDMTPDIGPGTVQPAPAPNWNAASARITSSISGKENRTFAALSPNQKISQIKTTYTTNRGAEQYVYYGLFGKASGGEVNGSGSCADGDMLVDVDVTWVNAPPGESINVTLGGLTKIINPATTTSPQKLIFPLPLGSTTSQVTAAFSTTSSCNANAQVQNNCPEFCENGIDDDGDGMMDCDDPDCGLVIISGSSVSTCVDQLLVDVANLTLTVEWSNIPQGESITVTVNGKKEYINPAAGATSPYTLDLIVPADGSTNNTISAGFSSSDEGCAFVTFDTPSPVSNDEINCDILYLSGPEKPADGDAWDHGFINYLDGVNNDKLLTAAFVAPDAVGFGLYDPQNPGQALNVNLNDYDLIIVSPTTQGAISNDLLNALKGYYGGILNMNFDILNDLGMSAVEGFYSFQNHAYIDNSTQISIYNYDNINPTNALLLTAADYGAGGTADLWLNGNDMAAGKNGVSFYFEKNDDLPGIPSAHGNRVFLGLHMNGLYANAQNGGALPAPVSSYFDPVKHLTLEGKAIFDQALVRASVHCNPELCNNGIDDNGNGEIDEGCVEICENGIDDDGDGLIDCDDPDCAPEAFGACILLNNPGFESDLSGWETDGTPAAVSDPYSGAKALRLTGANHGVSQTIPVTAGQVYRLEAWAKKTGSNWAGFGIDWLNAGGNEIAFAADDVNSSNYQYFSVIGVPPVGATQARIWAYSDGGMSAYFDDFCFSTTGGTLLEVGSGANILGNGGFESHEDDISFATTLQGSPAAAVSNAEPNVVDNWVPAIPNNYIFYINDQSDAVNNPEGDHFMWIPGNSFCWATNSSIATSFPFEDGKPYVFSFYAAPWHAALNGSGFPTGSGVSQSAGTISVEAIFGNGSTPKQISEWKIPASSSWNNLNWQKFYYLFTYDAANPLKSVYFTNPGNVGIAIDGVEIRKVVQCEVEICNNGLDDDGDGLVDCDDPDCALSLSLVPYHAGCSGLTDDGAINAFTTGGATPYTYVWEDVMPTARWDFENNTDDASGNNYHQNGGSGNISYSDDQVTGRHAASFDGSTYLRFSRDGGFMEITFSKLSFATWIKPGGLSGIQTIIDEGGATNGISLRLNGNILEGAVRNGSNQFDAGTFTFPNDGAWHHVGFVFDQGRFVIYLDGVAGAEVNCSFSTVSPHSGNGGLGYLDGGSGFGNGSGDYFTGLMDDVRYYFNEALATPDFVDMYRKDGDRTLLVPDIYTLKAFDANGCMTTSSTTVLLGTNYESGGAISGNESLCSGMDAGIISNAGLPGDAGDEIQFSWQQSTDGGANWIPIVGESGSSYDPPVLTVTTMFRRGARKSPCPDWTYTTPITKTVIDNLTDPGSILGDETRCGSYDPGLIISSAAVSGGSGGTIQYQWQLSTDQINWSDITGGIADIFDPPTVTLTTYYRRAARRSPCSEWIYSNIITKIVTFNYTDAGSIAGDENECVSFDPGLINSLTLPSGGAFGAQEFIWQKSTDGGVNWADIAASNTATYDPPFITQSTLFRRGARRTPCSSWVYSNSVSKTVGIYPLASMETYPIGQNGFLCEIATYTFAAADAGTGANYFWEFGSMALPQTTTGKGPHNVSFDVPNNIAVTDIQVILSVNLSGCVSMDTIQLSLKPEPVVTGFTPTNPSTCGGTDGVINVNVTYPPGTTVQVSIDGGQTFGANNQVSFTGLSAGAYDIAVKYSNGDCLKTAGSITLSDPQRPYAIIIESYGSTCTGSTLEFTAEEDLGGATYHWNFGDGATPATANGLGPHQVLYGALGDKVVSLLVIKNGCTNSENEVFSVVQTFTNGGTINGNEIVCSNTVPSLIVNSSLPSGGGGGDNIFEYQWEKRTDDGAGGWNEWEEIPGATEVEYMPSTLPVVTQFRRKARRYPCTDWVISNEVTKTLGISPTLGRDYFYLVCPGLQFVGNVLNNDINVTNAVLSIESHPANGQAELQQDGDLIFTPSSSYCGLDSLMYKVCNNGGVCCEIKNAVFDMRDTSAPALINIPADITVNCDEQIPLPPFVLASENCFSVELGLDEVSTQGIDNCSLFDYIMTRSWTAVDFCGNSRTRTQLITVEDKTAPDIFRIYTLPNGKKMVAAVIENVTTEWKTVRFPIDFLSIPAVFTQLSSDHEKQSVTVRIRNVSDSQFDIRLQEQDASDKIHARENVSWVAIETGPATNNPMLLKAGIITANHNWTNLLFEAPYSSSPVFLANMQTSVDIDPASMRYKSLSGTGVDLRVQEETSVSSDIPHAVESVAYLAMNSGKLRNKKGEAFGEAGKLSLTDQWQTVNLLHKYHNPVVIANGLSFNESDPALVRVRNVTDTSFQIQIDEWDAYDSIHIAETVSYLVVEGSIPFDTVVDCHAIPNPFQIGTEIIAVDNCDNTIVINYSEGANTTNCNGQLFRIWSVEDECGNNFTVTQKLIIQDTLKPEFTVPADVRVVCTDDIDDLNITGHATNEYDNCSVGLTAIYYDLFQKAFSCDSTYLVSRIWELTDDCGNVTQKIQKIRIENKGILLAVKVKLQGALINTIDGLMRDDLRQRAFIPLKEPYSRLPHFQHIGGGGEQITDTSVLQVTGPNAIVDWVFIELRDPIKTDSVIATKSALLQRDGDVVDVDGISNLFFSNLAVGSYIVSVRHRNHLGVMTLNSVYLETFVATLVDMSATSTTVFGNNAMNLSSFHGRNLWSGDLNGDRKSVYQGPANDPLRIFLDIIAEPNNPSRYPNYIKSGYEQADLDLDGNVIFQGPNNDRAKLLLNVILRSQENLYKIANFIVTEKIPR